MAGLALVSPARAQTDCDAKFREMVKLLAEDEAAAPARQIVRMRRLAMFYEVCSERNESMTDMARAVAEEAFGRPGN